MVAVQPAGPTLGLREDKAVLDEDLGLQVELPQYHRIAATAR